MVKLLESYPGGEKYMLSLKENPLAITKFDLHSTHLVLLSARYMSQLGKQIGSQLQVTNLDQQID